MASTYSTLKVELIGTGDQTGTWGTTTNNNFSVAFGEAITGSADVAFSSADVTVTLTDTNAAQTARNLRLNLTGTSGGARQLILGSGCQIEKLYLINNGLADAVTVKNTSGTGIAVPAGKSMFVFNNGTNVIEAVTGAVNLSIGTLAVTGTSTFTGAMAVAADSAFNSTGSLTVSKGTTGQRPASPVSGMFRFNTTTAEFEGYNGTAFASVGGAALSNDTATASNLFPLFANATTGTASSVFTSNAQYLFKPSTGELSVKAPRASNGIVVNSATVAANYTIASGDNAMSTGPIVVNSGITITVTSGQRWVIL